VQEADAFFRLVLVANLGEDLGQLVVRAAGELALGVVRGTVAGRLQGPLNKATRKGTFDESHYFTAKSVMGVKVHASVAHAYLSEQPSSSFSIILASEFLNIPGYEI
jgi:hypothetical protein